MTPEDQTAADPSAFVGSWDLDASRTSIVFHTSAMWVFKVKGTINALSGDAIFGPDGTVSGTLVFDAASIDTGTKKRDDHLRTADFFEVAAYPTITFTLSSARADDLGTVSVAGELAIHGQTRPLNFAADVSTVGDSATVHAEFDLDRSAWGLTWAKMGAGLKNHVVISARFTKRTV
ncbi:MAG TPA: YceI family protein [Acidimicrobiales bacterium]|jgi:polyisoprenoid-binding protein YceI|nr:YceI family protein [Acidimicrobiales bacterium]